MHVTPGVLSVYPPNANAAVFEAPSPASEYLAVIIAPPAVHVDPLYASVHATAGTPPNPNADVFVPAPARWPLAVIIVPPDDHEVPLYASVHPTPVPPKANDAVFVPAPARLYLAVDKAPPADHAAGPVHW